MRFSFPSLTGIIGLSSSSVQTKEYHFGPNCTLKKYYLRVSKLKLDLQPYQFSGILTLALFIHNAIITIMSNNKHQEKNVSKQVYQNAINLINPIGSVSAFLEPYSAQTMK